MIYPFLQGSPFYQTAKILCLTVFFSWLDILWVEGPEPSLSNTWICIPLGIAIGTAIFSRAMVMTNTDRPHYMWHAAVATSLHLCPECVPCELINHIMLLLIGCEWWSGASEVQTCICPIWYHCHSLSLHSVKSGLVLSFWYQLTWVVSAWDR